MASVLSVVRSAARSIFGARTSSGQPTVDTPPIKRLRAPELQTDTLAWAGQQVEAVLV